MGFWIGDENWQPRFVIDPYIGGDDGVRHQIQRMWIGDANRQPRLFFARPGPVDLTGSSPSWDKVDLSWNEISLLGGSSYKLYRGSTLIYQDTGLSFQDTGLLPNTNYTYRIDAFWGGSLNSSDTLTVKTKAPAAVDLVIGAVTVNSIAMSWNLIATGATYILKRGTTQIYSGPNLNFTDTGLALNTTYNYTLEAYLSGVKQSQDTASATTLAAVKPTLTATAGRWDIINLSWTSSAPGATYVLYQGSTQIYNNTGLTKQDAGLFPGTNYAYTLYTYVGGVNVFTSTASASTPARTLTASAGALDYATIRVYWTDDVQGSIDAYGIWQDGTYLGDVPGSWRAWDSGGLAGSSTHHYHVMGRRAGTNIEPQAWTGYVSTPARPTSSASIYSGLSLSYYSWTECTQKGLNAPNFNMPNGGYVTAFNISVAGYSPSYGRFNADIDGNLFGWRATDVAYGYPTAHYQGVGTGDFWRDAGAHHIGASVGGNCTKTQWYSYSSSYGSTLCWGQVNYWWYTALERDEELRQHPWWSEAFEGRDVHLDIYQDGTEEGRIVRVKITDKTTSELLADWAEEATNG